MALKIGDAVLMIGGDTSKLDKSLKGIGDKMSQVGKNLTMKLTAPLVAFGALSLKAAVDFEDAFAGVRKTVEATEEELALLNQQIRDLTKELPLTHAELAGIAEAAGQLGIETENIISFTKVMAQLGMATNMTGQEAATTFARFANITGMDTSFFPNLGSVIVDLGNNMATTEGEIAQMAMRLAGAGTVIGLSQSEIMALGAALSSVGIMAEAGGTAFSRVMLEMNSAVAAGGEQMKLWADATGLSVEEFNQKFQEDAVGAVMEFIAGLKRMQESGQDIQPMLDEMNLGGIRITDALLRAAGAQELFTDAQEIAAKAWEENSALQEEAAKRLETTKSRMAILKNTMTDVGITVGEFLVPKLQKLMDWLMPIIEKIQAWIKDNPILTETIMKIVGALAILGPALMFTSTAIKAVTALTWLWHNVLSLTAIKLIALRIALIAFTVQVYAAVIAQKVVTAAQWLWNAALMANPIGLIILAIAAFGAAMAALGMLIHRHWDGIVTYFGNIGNSIKTVFMNIAEYMYKPIKTAVNWIINVINSMIRGINNAFGWLGLSIPQIAWGMPESLFGGGQQAGGQAGKGVSAEQRREQSAAAIEERGRRQRDTGPIKIGGYQHGGPILGPTVLSSLRTGMPYAIAGERGPESVVPGGGYQTANIVLEIDGVAFARVAGVPIVDEIRLKTGVRL